MTEKQADSLGQWKKLKWESVKASKLGVRLNSNSELGTLQQRELTAGKDQTLLTAAWAENSCSKALPICSFSSS